MTAQDTVSVASVLSRMATIESRFGIVAPRPSPPAPESRPSLSFDDVLGMAQSSSTASMPVVERGAAPADAAPSGAANGGDYAALFAAAGSRHGVDAGLLAAVAHVESAMNPRAVSPAGAQGLMQLMPATAAGLGVADPFDPAQAVDGAARLLRSHLDRFGSLELALAAYNAGPGAVSRHGGIPPYVETQAYVRRVLDRYGASR